MFYYYGRKRKLSRWYPPPAYGTIVEPFAGSAAYACRDDCVEREVILVERDPDVANLWRWLLSLSPADVAALPDIHVGERTTEFAHIVSSASKRAFDYRSITVTKVMEANWRASKRLWQRLLPLTSGWSLIEGDYTEAPDIEATWFIDPPYSGEPGTGYRFGSPLLDYSDLGAWCQARRGQVIACEAVGANWLPFQSLVELVGVAGKRSSEAVWIRE